MEKFELNAQDAVLLIIDLQEKLMPPMAHRDQVCKNTGLLLEAARQFHIPVVVTQQYPKGLGHTVPQVTQELPEDHQVMDKMSFDAAADGLLPLLEKIGRSTVMVCGSETHVCVYQTVRSLLSSGYKVFPIQDAICSRFTHNYKSGLALMRDMGATVITAEGAAFDLMKISGTPEFKVISKALK